MRVLSAVLLVTTLALAGCFGGGSSCTIETNKYNCSFGGGGSIDRSDEWENQASKARVDVNLGGSGDVTIRIEDAAGTQVFDETYSGSGATESQGTTDPGDPGTWTVHIQGQVAGGFDVTVEAEGATGV